MRKLAALRILAVFPAFWAEEEDQLLHDDFGDPEKQYFFTHFYTLKQNLQNLEASRPRLSCGAAEGCPAVPPVVLSTVAIYSSYYVKTTAVLVIASALRTLLP